jgi:hypothetical protein
MTGEWTGGYLRVVVVPRRFVFKIQSGIESGRKKLWKMQKKAVRKTGATRYFFLSPRTYSPLALRQLESNITKELNIPATCLGGREIAEFIVDAGLTRAFLDAIDAPLAAGIAARPDNREILLHAYSNLSPDKHKHQIEIYDESLLLAAKINGPLTRASLVGATIALLSCPEERAEKLSARVGVLLSRRHLYQIANKQIIIDRAVSDEIDLSERYIDSQGRFADFHALRMTFSTLLAQVGVAERVRMELNRHSDPRLTAYTYTDASMLPLSGAVGMLPLLTGGNSDSQ